MLFLLNSAAWNSDGLMESPYSPSLMGMIDTDESKMRDASSGMLDMTVCDYDLSASFTLSSSLWQNGQAKSHSLKEPKT